MSENLQTAQAVGTIVLALVAVLGALAGVILFVIRSVIAKDVTPVLLELKQAINQNSSDIKALDKRFDRLESMLQEALAVKQ